MKHRSFAFVAMLAAGLPAQALAADCTTLNGSSPIIYGAGGSAQTNLVGKAAVVLQGSTSPVFVVYQDSAGACAGINALAGVGPTSITGSASYWDSAGVKGSCTLALTGNAVQFAVMGNSPLLCPLITDPSLVADITDVTGPISSVNVFVPNASTQQSISSEAFYLIYGLGAAAGIAPWTSTDPAYFIHRNENSFVQLYLATASTLPVTKFYGVDAGTNANSVAYAAALANPEQGIAFASGDVADANRATVRTLAWQQAGQDVAYWPDSSATAFDKANVRSGQYYLWGANHFYGLQGVAEGSFADANVAAYVGYLSGASQPVGTTKTITETAVANKNVPTCAMHAQRSGDLGPVFAYEATEPCDCYFDFKATGATTCDVCDDSTPCATGTCRLGYCEAR